MLPIRHLVAKNAKKFAVYNLCLILSFISLCNIFIFSCFAATDDPTSSVTETATQSEESSTESITDVSTVSTEEAIEEASEYDNSLTNNSDIKFLLLVIVTLLLILNVVIVFRILI